jgi:tetratricopeptide (TPR) repeat protein
MYRRADALARTGKPADAIPLLREALGIAERAGNPIVRVNVMIELLSAYDGLGRADEANALAPVAEAAAQAVPYDPLRAIRLANVLGSIAYSSGRMADAERHYREVVAIQDKRATGKPSAKLAGGLYNLANAVHGQGRGDEARTLQERALAIFEATAGPTHPDTALAIGALAGYAYEAKRYADAIALFRRQIAIWEGALGADHPNLAEPLSGLARAESVQGNSAEAITLYRRAIAVANGLGEHHPLVAQTQYRLAGELGKHEQLAEAAALAEQSVAAWDNNGFDIPDAHLARFMLAEYRWDAGQHVAARKLARVARAGLAKADTRYAANVAEIDAWLKSHP